MVRYAQMSNVFSKSNWFRTMTMRALFFCLLLTGIFHSAFAGPIEIQSLQIVPSETSVGRHPEITGTIKATRVLARGEILDITVIAAVIRPDHVMKSWTWKNVSMRSGDIRSFSLPNEYEVKLAGIYKVDFNVYSKDMLPIHRLSKTFVAVDQALPPATTMAPEDERGRIQATPGKAVGRQAKSLYFGVGLYADTVHSSGGATMLLWPFTYVGLQASYTGGLFTIAEGRLLARFPFSSGITPYLGAGYLDVATERSVEVIDIKTSFKDSGVSGVIGLEVPLGKSIFGSIELSGASIDLTKEVSSGGITGTASVKYSPVTIGISIVYYLF